MTITTYNEWDDGGNYGDNSGSLDFNVYEMQNPINQFTNINGCDSVAVLNLTINTCYIYGCLDSLANNYNPFANIDDSTCLYSSFIFGCTDTSALNYDSLATIDDSSCCYNHLKFGFKLVKISMDSIDDNFGQF